jgi:hypothetical protein
MTITVTHNTTGNQADILKHQVFGVEFSKAMQCTILISIGGAAYPIKEPKEVILSLLQNKETSDVADTKPN